MTAKKRRILCLSALFLAFLASFVWAWYEWGIGADHGAFRQDSVKVSLMLNGQTLLSQDTAVAVEQNGTLTLQNAQEDTFSFLLISDGVVVEDGTLAPKEQKALQTKPASGALFSLVLKNDTHRIAYLSSAKDTDPATDFLAGGDLCFLRQSSFDSLCLTGAYRLFGNFSFQSLTVQTLSVSPIVLAPRTPFLGDLLIDAPESRVYTNNFTPPFPDSLREYFVTALSWNDVPLDPLSFPVADFDALWRLADPDTLPALPSNARITIDTSFSLQKDLTFAVPVSLTVSAPIDFDAHVLSFTYQDYGQYHVKTAQGASVDVASLDFSAPLCDLFWESDQGTVPAFSTVEKFYNIASFNEQPLSLGGTGDTEAHLVIYPDGKDAPDTALTFTPYANLLVAQCHPLVSLTDLDGAAFDLTATAGTATLEGNFSDGRIVTRDEKGRERRYALFLWREDYGIPNVYVETEEGKAITSKKLYVSASFAMSGAGENIPETHLRIRGRGNSTWKWDKKPYKLSFDEPVSLFGLAPARSYALFASFADKSLMRGRIASVMAQEFSFAYTPTQHFVNFYLNGVYQGVYGLGEHLEEGEGRVEIRHEMNARDCGFFVEVGGVESGVNVQGFDYFHAGLLKFVLIKSPDPEEITSEQFSYIRKTLQKADEAIKAGENIEEYFDLTSLVDWLIMTEWTNNTDCAWRRSTYIQKDAGGKLVMGPVWDFDLAFGNFSKDKAGFDIWVSFSEDDDYVGETWSTYLLQNPAFRYAFKTRFLELRDRVLQTALDEIDRGADLLSDSATLNFEKWQILGRKVAFERHDTTHYPTYESQIRYLKNFLIDRAAWLTEQVESW